MSSRTSATETRAFLFRGVGFGAPFGRWIGDSVDRDEAQQRSGVRLAVAVGMEGSTPGWTHSTTRDAKQIWGLALRKDRGGLQLLLERLESDPVAGDEWAAADILDLSRDTPVEELCRGLSDLLADEAP